MTGYAAAVNLICRTPCSPTWSRAGIRDPAGRTVPRTKRHFPLDIEAAVRSALSLAPQSPFGKQAACRDHGRGAQVRHQRVGTSRSAFGELDPADMGGFPERRFTRFPPEIRRTAAGAQAHLRVRRRVRQAEPQARGLRGAGEHYRRSTSPGQTDWPDVVCRYNHHDDQLLGTTLGAHPHPGHRRDRPGL